VRQYQQQQQQQSANGTTMFNSWKHSIAMWIPVRVDGGLWVCFMLLCRQQEPMVRHQQLLHPGL
jgi:hypothetical protein